jgi:hypothetical protein
MHIKIVLEERSKEQDGIIFAEMNDIAITAFESPWHPLKEYSLRFYEPTQIQIKTCKHTRIARIYQVKGRSILLQILCSE